MMKTSFARTFADLAKDQPWTDQMFRDRLSSGEIIDEAGAEVSPQDVVVMLAGAGEHADHGAAAGGRDQTGVSVASSANNRNLDERRNTGRRACSNPPQLPGRVKA